jgi:hypothetical protein
MYSMNSWFIRNMTNMRISSGFRLTCKSAYIRRTYVVGLQITYLLMYFWTRWPPKVWNQTVQLDPTGCSRTRTNGSCIISVCCYTPSRFTIVLFWVFYRQKKNKDRRSVDSLSTSFSCVTRSIISTQRTLYRVVFTLTSSTWLWKSPPIPTICSGIHWIEPSFSYANAF